MSETLIERLRKMRKVKGLTLFELAMRMRLNQAVISRIEKGILQPSEEQADIIRAFISGKL